MFYEKYRNQIRQCIRVKPFADTLRSVVRVPDSRVLCLLSYFHIVSVHMVELARYLVVTLDFGGKLTNTGHQFQKCKQISKNVNITQRISWWSGYTDGKWATDCVTTLLVPTDNWCIFLFGSKVTRWTISSDNIVIIVWLLDIYIIMKVPKRQLIIRMYLPYAKLFIVFTLSNKHELLNDMNLWIGTSIL